MKLATIREIWNNKEAWIGHEISVGGWVRSNRDSKAFGFLTISDGTWFDPLQIVYSVLLFIIDRKRGFEHEACNNPGNLEQQRSVDRT